MGYLIRIFQGALLLIAVGALFWIGPLPGWVAKHSMLATSVLLVGLLVLSLSRLAIRGWRSC